VTSVGSRGTATTMLWPRRSTASTRELIHRQGPTVEQVELATARWVAWWNAQRLHGACGDVPPAESEAAYRERQETPIAVA
jgi:putative transposase